MKKSRIFALLLSVCLVITALAAPLAPITVDGAQVRTIGEQGLRFTSSVSISDLSANEIVEYGTVLIPSESLENDADLVIGATLDGRTVAKVAALKTYKEEGDSRYFTAVITGIKKQNYTRAYSARAYITYREEGNEQTVYSDTVTSRDVYTVAKAALADTEANLTDEDKAVLQAVVDYVEGITVPVTFTKPVENAQVPLQIEVDGYEATISWTRTGGYAHTGKFESGTDYTATITLTAEEAFSPNDKVTINGENVTPSFSADYKTITVKKTFEFKDSGYSGIY